MLIAYFQTVKTVYAATIINSMVFTVYASSFTLSRTQTTTITLILINPNFK